MSSRGRADKRPDDRIGPTPETLAHWIANPDPMLQVLGYPPHADLEAAWKGIERGYQLRTEIMGFHIGKYERTDRGADSEWSSQQHRDYQRYMTWAGEARRQQMRVDVITGVICGWDKPKWNVGLVMLGLRLYVKLHRRKAV